MALKLVDEFLENDFNDPAYNDFIQLSYLYNKNERINLLQLSNDDTGLHKSVFALTKFILALPDHPEKMTNEEKENIKASIVFIDEVELIYKYNKSFLKKYEGIDKDIIDKFILLNSSPKLIDKLKKNLIDGLERIKGLDDLILEVESKSKLLKANSSTERLLNETTLIISKSREEMTLSEIEKFVKVFEDYKKKITSALDLQENGINPFGCIIALSMTGVLVALAYRLILYLIKS